MVLDREQVCPRKKLNPLARPCVTAIMLDNNKGRLRSSVCRYVYMCVYVYEKRGLQHIDLLSSSNSLLPEQGIMHLDVIDLKRSLFNFHKQSILGFELTKPTPATASNC
jgi:hypothetical protein